MVAASLVKAELRGHSSHGVLRIAQDEEMIRDGAIDPTACPTVVAGEGATASVDVNQAFGSVTGREATAEVAAGATEHGIAAIGIRNGTHLSRIGEWAERVTDASLCFMAFVNTSGGAKSVAPPGAADERLATNPIAFGVPRFECLPSPVIYDGATSRVANSKIRERAVGDESVPEEWANNAGGKAA